MLQHKGAGVAPWNWEKYRTGVAAQCYARGWLPPDFLPFPWGRDLPTPASYPTAWLTGASMPRRPRRWLYAGYLRELRATRSWLLQTPRCRSPDQGPLHPWQGDKSRQRCEKLLEGVGSTREWWCDSQDMLWSTVRIYQHQTSYQRWQTLSQGITAALPVGTFAYPSALARDRTRFFGLLRLRIRRRYKKFRMFPENPAGSRCLGCHHGTRQLIASYSFTGWL